ncbi:MAG: hypothetical protein HC924_06930 [Synechococcaceae cyanobacterium SM2_3_2]|nr:hypothetical protein [Synechococcaceae cyanobacterium SM2_3_2]
MKPRARTQVMTAVEQLGWRVTLGDVASSTGLALPETKQELLSLAQEAEGHLQVADTGEIAYVFDKDFRATLRRKENQSRWQKFQQKLWGGFLYGLRISFGILLLVSIVLITLALVALMIASRSNDNNNRSSRGGGGMNFIFLPRLWVGNPFWSPYPSRRGYRGQRYNQGGRSGAFRQTEAQAKGDMNFLEAVYSFLFGDGNPNEDLEEKRYQYIATLIRQNDGVITAEQVLPYLDLDLAQADNREDAMLPILLKFDGSPEVSDQGELVYRFPELQVTAAEQKRKGSSVPATLEEELWAFSKAEPGQLTLAGGLGALNVVLALILYGARDQVALGAAQGSPILALVNPLVGLLLLYGVAFLTVPVIRWMTLKRRNQKIQARVKTRQQWANQLRNPDQKLQHKLEFAQRFARREVVGENQTIYSTDRDLIEQRDYELDRPEFQALLDDEKSLSPKPD